MIEEQDWIATMDAYLAHWKIAHAKKVEAIRNRDEQENAVLATAEFMRQVSPPEVLKAIVDDLRQQEEKQRVVEQRFCDLINGVLKVHDEARNKAPSF